VYVTVACVVLGCCQSLPIHTYTVAMLTVSKLTVSSVTVATVMFIMSQTHSCLSYYTLVIDCSCANSASVSRGHVVYLCFTIVSVYVFYLPISQTKQSLLSRVSVSTR
jgi:hypothetical protein